MPKTPDEIKKGLEDYFENRHALTFEQWRDGLYSIPDVIAYIQQLESRNLAMYNTILSVMHFVDKWLDCPDYDPDADMNGVDAVQRAVKAREIALQAIEQLEAERDAAVKDLHNALKLSNEIDVCRFCNRRDCTHDGICDIWEHDCWEWRGVQKEE